jgi:site-specific DNA recombinase
VKAAIYARFSTEKQSEASIEDQFRVCERIAEREGFNVVARFSDAAISGGTSARGGYQALLKAARRREFDVIVAEDSSRLWRELSEQRRALKELQDLGVHVVGHGLDTRREESKILLAVSGAMAEAYRDEIARRTRRGLEGRALAGAPTGGKAYGYIAARDSGTGKVEIDQEQAAVVCRIFELHASGASPRTIAMTLNDEGVPSPGSQWKRTSRRKSGWLASAIHGDVERGSGILNNPRYIGIVKWGRSRWTRGASDSSKRRMNMKETALHEATEERLRIVPQELWERVRARQALRRSTVGARVKGSVKRNSPGQGRPPRHVLSGLLRCGVCGASFSLADSRSYACASHVNGALCSNKIRVTRKLVEQKVLETVKTDLRDPEIMAEIESRVAREVAAQKPKADHSPRIAELQREVGNLTEAIASGLLKASPALAKRLAVTESELSRLQAERNRKQPALGKILPRIGERYLQIVEHLEEGLRSDPELARAALTDAIGSRIMLEPDESGKFLWAEFGLETTPQLVAVGLPEFMVAGA